MNCSVKGSKWTVWRTVVDLQIPTNSDHTCSKIGQKLTNERINVNCWSQQWVLCSVLLDLDFKGKILFFPHFSSDRFIFQIPKQLTHSKRNRTSSYKYVSTVTSCTYWFSIILDAKQIPAMREKGDSWLVGKWLLLLLVEIGHKEGVVTSLLLFWVLADCPSHLYFAWKTLSCIQRIWTTN